jgi:hypothetical protein
MRPAPALLAFLVTLTLAATAHAEREPTTFMTGGGALVGGAASPEYTMLAGLQAEAQVRTPIGLWIRGEVASAIIGQEDDNPRRWAWAGPTLRTCGARSVCFSGGVAAGVIYEDVRTGDDFPDDKVTSFATQLQLAVDVGQPRGVRGRFQYGHELWIANDRLEGLSAFTLSLLWAR